MTIVPRFGATDQLRAVFVVPCTVAEYNADWPAISVVGPDMVETLIAGAVGATLSMGCASNTVAVAVLVGSATMVAEIVTCDSLLYADGAV